MLARMLSFKRVVSPFGHVPVSTSVHPTASYSSSLNILRVERSTEMVAFVALISFAALEGVKAVLRSRGFTSALSQKCTIVNRCKINQTVSFKCFVFAVVVVQAALA